MRKLQLVRETYKDGKKEDSKNVGKERKVADSIAENLVQESDSKRKTALADKVGRTIEVWVDNGPIKRTAKKKRATNAEK